MVTENNSESVGDRLKRLRTDAGYTQQHLSLLSGVPYPTIRGYEYGRRVPSLRNLFALAGAFKLDPGEMLRGVELPPFRRPPEVTEEVPEEVAEEVAEETVGEVALAEGDAT